MMDTWVVEILKTYGLAGVVIAALGATIAILWSRLGDKDIELAKLNEERAAERETLVKLIESGNSAASTTANATSDRNRILEDLARALTSQANSVERYEDRVQNQAEMFRGKLEDFRHVVDAFGEAHRNNSGLVMDIRNGINVLQAAINQMAVSIASRGIST